MSSVVFDASALLAILNTEAGHDKAREYLEGAIISAVNYSEVLKKSVETGGGLAATQLYLDNFSLNIVPFDQKQAALAAELWPASRAFGLSFADRACLSLGIERKAKVLTGDRRWMEVALGVPILLFR